MLPLSLPIGRWLPGKGLEAELRFQDASSDLRSEEASSRAVPYGDNAARAPPRARR